jgi:hypothetical protein
MSRLLYFDRQQRMHTMTHRDRSDIASLARQVIVAAFFFCCTASVAQTGNWSELANRVGPYSGILTIADAKAAAADGFNLTVQSTYDPAILASMRDLGINHIDLQLWAFIYAQCKIQFDREIAAGGTRHCDLSADAQQSILRDAKARLDKVKNDPSVAAYWILDDYPWGNVTSTLVALHRLVNQANQETGANKPTICGIGGSLDHRTATNQKIIPDRAYIELALQNITPGACDVVAPYFYGSATENDPTWIDWSMRDLMPWFMQRLRGQGFNHPALLPVPQAFFINKRGGTTYFVQPRAADIAAQANTYCGSGAIALLFFTWQSADAERSYVNDADLREGVRQAAAACRGQGLKIPAVGRGAR